MDLVVLIDDENAGLDPGHLVQMMGDLLERVSFFLPWGRENKADKTGNQLRGQATAKGKNTNHQAQPCTFTCVAFR
jgi:hypothetical protein